MVSSVLVELVGDNGKSPFFTKLGGEKVEGGITWDRTLCVGEEGIFRMEIKIWHASTSSLLKPIGRGLGNEGHPPNLYKKRDIILLAFFCLATANFRHPGRLHNRTSDLNPNH